MSIEARRKISQFMLGNSYAKGNKLSEEQRKKISERSKKYIATLKTREKISKALKGRKFSDEWRKKISESKKGKKCSDETKKKMSKSHIGFGGYWKGKKHTEEHKRKVSESLKGRSSWNKGKKASPETRRKISESHRGEKSCLWKGGITLLTRHIRTIAKYLQWRSDVFQRDNWTCQTCQQRGGNLEAHHIKRLQLILKQCDIKTIEGALACEELWNIDNGVTLCKKCHKLI